jgi:hypothetical protein
MKVHHVAFLLALMLAVAGCAKDRAAQLVGEWSGAGATLQLREDKTFELTSSMAAGQAVTGSWALAESTVMLSPVDFGGRSAEEAIADLDKLPEAFKDMASGMREIIEGISLQVAEDNKTMTTTLTVAGQPQAMEFVKQGS